MDCPICGCVEFVSFFTANVVGETIQLRVCCDCGIVYQVTPRTEEFRRREAEKEAEKLDDFKREMAEMDREQEEVEAQLKEDLRVLDISLDRLDKLDK